MDERYENVEFFGRNKDLPDFLDKILPILDNILKNKGEMMLYELAEAISKKINYGINMVYPCINYLVYSDHFLLNFETKIDDTTILKHKGEETSLIVPFYRHLLRAKKRNKLNRTSPNKHSLDKDEANHDGIPRTDIEYLRRENPELYKIVKERLDLIEIFYNPGFSTKKLLEHAKENNVSKSALYDWRKKYEELGWGGLVPEKKKCGRKKGKDVEVEKLMEKVIEEDFLSEGVTASILHVYENDFLDKCDENGIEEVRIPHYSTFYRRILEIARKKKMKIVNGRKVTKDNFKPLEGRDKIGKYPLERVEFDHTILDIMLVDLRDNKPIGRPVITVAVDVYSRMVWGYYLSYDHEDTTSVGMCMLNGLLPKEKLLKKHNLKKPWKIHGYPKTVVVDNGKQYRSPIFKDFLDANKRTITAIWNPPKCPEKKPHVERFIKTINLTIKNEFKNKGYIPPIEYRKKTGYDPSKYACFTLDQFEDWLLNWIVETYHYKNHGGLKDDTGLDISPAERYDQGLVNVDGRTIGSPEVPSNPENLKYELLPFDPKGRQLRRVGIEIFNLEYYNSIVGKLLARQTEKDRKKKWMIRYDPRDIKEVYLYVDTADTYYPIPIKNRYNNRIIIDDNPISLKELKLFKKRRKNKNTRIDAEQLTAYRKRQKKINESASNVKQVKKARKMHENRRINANKATSTRRIKKNEGKNKSPVRTSKPEANKKREVDLDAVMKELEQHKFKTERRKKRY
ncbi:MAG: Mu transposase C-terminal domain-containing protein [Promethearchaeota archaeon]